MIPCKACHRPNPLYLCDDCQEQLRVMLDQLPWLLEELDNRIQCLTRYQTGTIGRSGRPDELTIIDFDAAETARAVRKKLLTWVETVAQRHTGRQPAALTTVTTKDLARWLQANTAAIARQDCAGDLYQDIKALVGTDHQPTGQLVRAINPTQHHLVGPCPTITGRTHTGQPRQCGHMLYADTYDQTVECPTCKQTINVEDNRRRTAAERDLHTRQDLQDMLTNIDEPITETQLNHWIKWRRLKRQAWLEDGIITEYNLTNQAQPLYSIQQARTLRRRDQRFTHRKHHT